MRDEEFRGKAVAKQSGKMEEDRSVDNQRARSYTDKVLRPVDDLIHASGGVNPVTGRHREELRCMLIDLLGCCRPREKA